MCEAGNGAVGVVHANHDTPTVLEIEDFEFLGLATVLGSELHGELAVAGHDEIRGAVLIAETVTADNDGLFPAGHELGDVVDKNGGAENDTVENVTDGSVRGTVHTLQVELLDAGLHSQI